MSNIVEKICANCGHKNFVYSEEYKNTLSKGDFEGADYQAFNRLTYVNIERCEECGYCNLDISVPVSKGIYETEKYKKLQEFSKFEENRDNHFHFLMIGAYVLEQTKDYLNASRAYFNVRKNLSERVYQMAKESLNEEQLKKYQPVFDYYEKIKEYCLDNAIELAKKQFELDGSIDAILLLYYYMHCKNDKEKSEKIKETIKTLNLTEEQTSVYNIISKL